MRLLKGLFVTGTDTAVGKTMVSAALMHRYRAVASLRYWKPIQTGIEEDDDTSEVERLAECRRGELFTAGIRLQRPVSPHLAAQWAGTTIDIHRLVESTRREPAQVRWIVEGAGGVLVPVNERELMVDLMSALGLPVVVAARASLGTINHTLLTLEALRHRLLHIAGVVMVGGSNRDNRAAIEHYGRTLVLGELPHLSTLTASALREWAVAELDPNDQLTPYLRDTVA